MTAEHWLSLVQIASMVVGGGLLWTVRTAFKSGEWATKIEGRVTENERRLDQAGKEMSDLATDVQGQMERNRGVFVALREFDKHQDSNNHEHRELWLAIERRRTVR